MPLRPIALQRLVEAQANRSSRAGISQQALNESEFSMRGGMVGPPSRIVSAGLFHLGA